MDLAQMTQLITTIAGTIGTLAGAIAAALAWRAKIRWSEEYDRATKATISSKDAEIERLSHEVERLRAWNPQTLEDYYNSTRRQLESVVQEQETTIQTVKAKLQEYEQQGLILSTPEGAAVLSTPEGAAALSSLIELESSRHTAKEHLAQLEKQLAQLEANQKEIEQVLSYLSTLPPAKRDKILAEVAQEWLWSYVPPKERSPEARKAP